MEEIKKRGRGRPPKWTEDNPKPKIDRKNPLEVIRKPEGHVIQNIILPEGDNNKYTTFALAIMQLPKIDVKNPEELRARVVDYFALCAEHDMKPGVAALSLALGLDRRRLWEMNTGVSTRNTTFPQECKDIVKTAYDSLEVLWESYMTNGKINPVSGIFLGKNNFGYRDQQEHIIAPGQTEEASKDVIEAKYD